MEPIVERIFEITGGGEVRLRLFSPQPEPTGDFACEFLPEWPDRRDRRTKIFGLDALQALLLALRHASSRLRASPEGESGRITWCGASDLGLSLPQGWEAPSRDSDE